MVFTSIHLNLVVFVIEQRQRTAAVIFSVLPRILVLDLCRIGRTLQYQDSKRAHTLWGKDLIAAPYLFGIEAWLIDCLECSRGY